MAKAVWLALAMALLVGAGCSDTPAANSDASAPLFGFDGLAGIDVPKDANGADASPETAAGDLVSGGDAQSGSDTAETSTGVVAVQAEVTATLDLGSKAPLNVTVQRDDGSGAPKTGEAVTFSVDGQPVEVGGKPGPMDQPPAHLAVWKTATAGSYWLVGVRPGKGQLSVSVGGVASEPVEVEVGTPASAGLKMVLAGAEGSCPGARTKDSDDTIRLEGKVFGKGGLTLTVRFPSAAQAGDAFDLDKASPKGGFVQVSAVMPDLGGQQVKVVTGRVWLDQVEKGWFRGSFLGNSAANLPVAGVFSVERNGTFGVDLLAEAEQLAASSTDQWTATGEHDSRASISALGGQAVLTWRHISNVTSADLVRRSIDPQSGFVAEMPPLVTKAVAQILVDDGSGALVPKPTGEFFGGVALAESGGKRLAVWEGKPAAKSASPYQISGQFLGADGKPEGAIVAISADQCWGSCRPRLVALPSTHFLVAWGVPTGGVKAVILDGNDLANPEKTVIVAPPPATGPSLASWEAHVGIAWRHPTQGTYARLYSDAMSSNGPEQLLGGTVINAAAPAIAAIAEPASFTALFSAPVGTLKQRRIGLDAALIGSGDVALGSQVARFVAAAGKGGQVAIVERLSGVAANQPQLRLRKVVATQNGDVGAQLGSEVILPASVSKYPLEPVICYVPEADTFVVAWSGDGNSEGVWVQRFR